MQKPPAPTVSIESDGRDMFVVADGVKIAKRGHPGTPQANTWVSVEPGWVVFDSKGGREIEVTYNGIRVH